MERTTTKPLKKPQKNSLDLDSPAWTRFVKSIKSEYTASYYVQDMKRFMVSTNINSPDELLLMERKALKAE